jgi:uncharacterized protein
MKLPVAAFAACLACCLAFTLAPALAAGAFPLSKGSPASRELKGGEQHDYALTMRAGEFAKVTVVQRGIDVVVTALAPDGSPLGEVDSPNGSHGPEPLSFAAKTTGPHVIRVRSPEPAAPAGAYDIRVEYLLSAEQYRKYSITKLDLAQVRACEGAYEHAPGHVVLVSVLNDLDDQLVMVDVATRRFGVLQAHSETEFFMGPGVMGEFPVERELEFRKGAGGAVTGVEIREGRAAPAFARRVAPRAREDVHFTSGPLSLGGALLLPEGAGPHPAMVMVAGSGPATRDLMPFTYLFAKLGFVVLSFDKRGVGESQGDWRTASFDELAGDVLAGIAYLKTRPEVDGARIGLWGVSQGGWIGSLAAAKSDDVKFLVVHAGSGVQVWENVVHEDCSGMRDAGLAGRDLEDGRAFAARLYRMAADSASFAQVRAVADSAKGRPWAGLVWLASTPENSPWWDWWRKNGHVDPSAIVPQIHCPVLWFLGDRDSQVPYEESARRLRAAFAAGGNPDATLKTLSPAGHPFLECSTGLRSELPGLERFVPGYLDSMSDWLVAHAGRR